MPIVQIVPGQYLDTDFTTDFILDTTTFTVPQPGTRWVWLLDLILLVGGTWQFSNYPVQEFPTYYPKIDPDSLPQIVKTQPDPLVGFLGTREATVILSNIKTESEVALKGKTVSQLALTEDLRGQRAILRLYDLDTQLDVSRLDGIIYSYKGGSSSATSELVLRSDDASLMQTKIPKIQTKDLFPAVDFSAVSTAEGHVPQWPLGPTKKAELAQIRATNIKAEFTMVAAVGNYEYVALTHVLPYTFQAGDIVTYEIEWDQDNALIALDVQTDTDSPTRLGTAGVDQNGLSANPTTNLNDKARNKNYLRRITVPSTLVGKTVSVAGAGAWFIACESDVAGTFTARIAKAYILDAGGNLRLTIYDQEILTPTFAIYDFGQAANTHTLTKEAIWSWGPIRGHGGVTVPTVYRDGAIVAAAEWTFANEPMTVGGQPIKSVQFTADQRAQDGRLPRMQADLESSEFAQNPAWVVSALMGDTAYGLSQSVNAPTFDTSAATYAAMLYKVGDCLRNQLPAIDYLHALLLHGATCDRDSTNAVTHQVDTAALHTTKTRQSGGPANLGFGDTRGLNNLDEIDPPQAASLDDWVKKLTYEAGFDPTFDGQAVFLLGTDRTRALPASSGREETIRNPFVYDIVTADKELHYLFERLKTLDRPWAARAFQEAHMLTLGSLTNLYLPNNVIDGTQMEVWSYGISGVDVTLTLAPYSAAPYAYVAGTSQRTNPKANVLTDYSRTFPSVPTNFSVVGYTVRQTTTGQSEVHVRLQADAPTVNAATLVFESIRQESIADVPSQQVIVGITVGQTGVLAELKVEAGLLYRYQVYARNPFNTLGFQDGIVAQLTNQLAPGDTTAPSAATAIAVRQDGTKAVEIEATFTEPSDWGTTWLYRNTSNSTTGLQPIEKGKKKIFHDHNITYGQIYYYWVKVVDHSGNASAFSPSTAHSITIGKLQTVDYDDNSVTGPKTSSLNAAKVTTGMLTVNGTVKINVTADLAMDMEYGVVARIRWVDGGVAKHEISAGTVVGIGDVLQLVTKNSSGLIRLGSSGEPFTHLGLWFTGNIRGDVGMFDGTAAPAAVTPDRRIRIESDGGTLVGYIWASTT